MTRTLKVNVGRLAAAEVVEAKEGSLEVKALFFDTTHDKAQAAAQEYVNTQSLAKRARWANRMFYIVLFGGGAVQLALIVIQFLMLKGVL